jgi:hypothetical protein
LTGDPILAHIHYGEVGVAGPPMWALAHGPSPFSGTVTEADFTPVSGGPQTHEEGLAAIRDGLAYVNVHTEMNQPGEIRGQLVELPPTSTLASGESLPVGLLAMMVIGAGALLFGTRRLVTAGRDRG